jgi:hypothetical protein
MQVVASETIELPRATASAHAYAWQTPASGCGLSGPAGEFVGDMAAGPHRNGTLLRVLEGKMIISIKFLYPTKRRAQYLSVCDTKFEGSVKYDSSMFRVSTYMYDDVSETVGTL